MREIKEFIKLASPTNVVEAFEKGGFDRLTISKGEGTGTQERSDASLDLEFFFTNNRMIKLDLICQNEEADKAVQLICEK